jgi:prepilin signal peptidase PulO-like enzyme (type II secretory pathway)
MTVLATVVDYSLPSVRDDPRRLRSWAYHLLTLTGAALAAASIAVFGFTPEGLAAAVFCGALAVVTAADLAYRLIPNRVVLPSSALVLALMTASDGSPEWALAALAACGGLFAVAFIYPAGMGMGDVKLAFLMGAALGRSVLPALMLAMLLAVVPAVFLLIRHGRAGRTMGIPFGPFLALASVVLLFAPSFG